MKNFCIIVLLLIARCSLFAQITSDVSYDATKKVITWTLTNNYDKKVQLVPPHLIDDGTGCGYKSTYKDANNKVVFVYSCYVQGYFISPKSSRSFKIPIDRSYKEKVKSVEFKFQEQVRLVDGLKTVLLDKKEFTRTYDLSM